MRREVKDQIIESISAQLQEFSNFYIADISGLNAGDTQKLRRACFEADVKLTVVKNTLFKIALDRLEDENTKELESTLKGNTAIMFTEVPNAPAKVIKKMNEDGMEKPVLKGAYVQECVFLGADKLEELVAIKSKEELIADVISLLQAPARNVVSALQSAGSDTIAGLVKTLSEKEEK